MTTFQNINYLAHVYLGYHEKANKHNQFGHWYDMDNEPWCAQFVSYIFNVAGLPLEIETDKGFAYCPNGVDYFKKEGWFSKNNPELGDIVFFDWTGEGVAEHVGIVVSVNNDGTISTIEGNTSDQDYSNGGTVAKKTRNTSLVYGYAKPPYTKKTALLPCPSLPQDIIKENTISHDVIVWKQQMIKRGWSYDTNPRFAHADAARLTNFQSEVGLDVDGEIGQQSWIAAWVQPVK